PWSSAALHHALFAGPRPPPAPPPSPYPTLLRSGHRVRDIFAPAPHAKAQLFGKQSVRQLQTLYRRKPLCGFQDFFIRGHAQSLRSEEHTSELQSRFDRVCRPLLEEKRQKGIVN